MALFASDVRMVFWIAVIPAFGAFLLAWLALREPEQHFVAPKASPFFSGFRHLDKATSGCWASASCSGLRASPKRS